MVQKTRDKQRVLGAQQRPKNCLIIGENTSNIGDLLLRLQLIDYAKTVIGCEKVFSVEWSYNLETLPIILKSGGKPLFIKNNFFKLMAAACGAEVMFGPGQIIRDNQSPYCIIVYLLIAVFARITGGRVILHGVGIGRIQKNIYATLWRMIAALCYKGFFRDEISLGKAEEILQMKGKAFLSADYAFLQTDISARFNIPKSGEGHLICAVCSDAAENRLLTPEYVAQALFKATQVTNITKTIFLLHATNIGSDRDFAQNCKLALDSLSRGMIEIDIIETLDLNEIADLYKSARLVVSNRLHSAIFGILAIKPVIVLDDGSDKLSPLADNFGLIRLKSNMTGNEIENMITSNIKAFEVSSYTRPLALCRKQIQACFETRD